MSHCVEHHKAIQSSFYSCPQSSVPIFTTPLNPVLPESVVYYSDVVIDLNFVHRRSPAAVGHSDVKNLDANGSASHPIHLHPPNDS